VQLKAEFPGSVHQSWQRAAKLKRPDEALASYERALRQTGFRGSVQQSWQALLSLNPEEALAVSTARSAQARLRIGVLQPWQRVDEAETLDEALPSYDRALAVEPDGFLLSLRLRAYGNVRLAQARRRFQPARRDSRFVASDRTVSSARHAGVGRCEGMFRNLHT
jgi:tetratricopeptide (TPR) repeat protein